MKRTIVKSISALLFALLMISCETVPAAQKESLKQETNETSAAESKPEETKPAQKPKPNVAAQKPAAKKPQLAKADTQKKPQKTAPEKSNPELDFSKQLYRLLQKDKIDEALALFETDNKVAHSENMQNLKLSLLISKQDFSNAKSLANELEKKYPNNTQTLLAQSILASAENNRAKKNQYLKKIISIEPKNTAARLLLAEDAFFGKAYTNAEKNYLMVLAIDKNNEEALVGLSNVYYMTGDFEKAENNLNAVLKRNNKNAAAYASLARVQFEQNKVLPALENIDKALKIEKGVATYYMDKGRYCTRANRKKEAVAAYTQAMKLEPDNYVAYVYRAGLNDDLKNDDAAIADYQKVVELYPQYYFASEGLGVLYFEREDYARAKYNFLSALEQKPDNCYYALMATLCFYEQGDAAGGKKFMAQYLPHIDRKNNDDEYFLSRLFVDHIAENDVVMRISKVADITKQYRMKFYLAKFYELVRQSKLAEKLYTEISECYYPAFFEYRFVELELAKRGIVPKVK